MTDPSEGGESKSKMMEKKEGQEEEKKSMEPFPNPNEIYRPIMLHLKCRGTLSFSSKDKNNFPKCHGIKSRLQPLREYPPMKPHAALQTFRNQTSFYHPDDDGGDSGSSNNNFSPSSSFGGRGKAAGTKRPTPKLPIIVDNKWDDLKEQLKERSNADLSKLNSESLSSSQNGNALSFHGSTDMYCLVLLPSNGMDGMGLGPNNMNMSRRRGIGGMRHHDDNPTLFRPPPWLSPYPDERTPNPWNSKSSSTTATTKQNNGSNQSLSSSKNNDNDGRGDTIDNSNDDNSNNDNDIDNIQNTSILYAVTPVNTFGISSREVKDGNGMGCSATTIKIGVLEISTATFEEEVEVYEDERDINQKRGGSQQENEFSDRDGETTQLDTIMSSLQKGQVYLDKLEKNCDKIQKSMVQNAKFIKKELENDFVNRSMAASEKIVGHFGKTLKRMEKLAVDVWKMWTDGGSGNGRSGTGGF